jgi:hypothetical protein
MAKQGTAKKWFGDNQKCDRLLSVTHFFSIK